MCITSDRLTCGRLTCGRLTCGRLTSGRLTSDCSCHRRGLVYPRGNPLGKFQRLQQQLSEESNIFVFVSIESRGHEREGSIEFKGNKERGGSPNSQIGVAEFLADLKEFACCERNQAYSLVPRWDPRYGLAALTSRCNVACMIFCAVRCRL